MHAQWKCCPLGHSGTCTSEHYKAQSLPFPKHSFSCIAVSFHIWHPGMNNTLSLLIKYRCTLTSKFKFALNQTICLYTSSWLLAQVCVWRSWILQAGFFLIFTLSPNSHVQWRFPPPQAATLVTTASRWCVFSNHFLSWKGLFPFCNRCNKTIFKGHSARPAKSGQKKLTLHSKHMKDNLLDISKILVCLSCFYSFMEVLQAKEPESYSPTLVLSQRSPYIKCAVYQHLQKTYSY